MTMQIAGREISSDAPPYIICELSGNHNGSLDRMMAMIDAAKATGADAIKIQTYTADTITIDHDGPEFLIEGGPWSGRRLHDLYQEAGTPWQWHEAMFARARELDIPLFSTPFDFTAVDLLEELGAPAFKIASFEIVDLPLIRRVAQTGKPMIISTGMANLEEIAAAVQTARSNGCMQLCLLHCTSAYPAPVEDANLVTIAALSDQFGVPAGLSDHTLGIAAPVAATALGATVIEKHFTLDRSAGGPDAEFSLEPGEFTQMVEACRAAHSAKGGAQFSTLGSEAGSIVFRRSLYVTATIKAGEVFTANNVRSIRPGYGLAPKHYDVVLGSTATQDLGYGTALKPEHVAALV